MNWRVVGQPVGREVEVVGGLLLRCGAGIVAGCDDGGHGRM
ncbi:MAG: hypothetical protein NZ483_07980 [Verrucomicrobiae bacterium]|nr:hypothetical protein [Verrucomicrobiae bacterium]MDW8342874.1 hypothetical protein [Verrucomicrobiae bacterium]